MRPLAERRSTQGSPFMVSGHIETGTLSGYLPFDARIDLIDIQLDSVEGGKEANMTVSMTSISKPTIDMKMLLRVGHSKIEPKHTVISGPVKISIGFDRPVSAWICLVVYPDTTIHIIPVKAEGEQDERVLLPGFGPV
jgi:hypothetical protein